MRRLIGISLLLAGCASTGPGESNIPVAGRYAFHAQWAVPGLAAPATADGTLTISSPSQTNFDYILSLDEQPSPVANSSIAPWSSAHDYFIISGTITRSVSWVLNPLFKRSGSGAQCRGEALNSTLVGTPLTCTFVYIGP